MSAVTPNGPERGDSDAGRDNVQEAWAIAAELVADLGAGDAIGWADEYMDRLQAQGNALGMRRWKMVTSALSELADARLH